MHLRNSGRIPAVAALILASACSPDDGGGTAPTPSATSTATASPSPSVSPSPTASPSPLMPSVTGLGFTEAEQRIADLTPLVVKAASAYRNVPLPAAHGTWKVCFQAPEAGTELSTGMAGPTLHLTAPATPCPSEQGAALPTPTPTPTPAKKTADAPYYRNCDAVRAAGAAPLHRGSPGYRAGLDRDGDGVACEPYGGSGSGSGGSTTGGSGSDSGSASGGSGGGSVYYQNCSAARAAGAAPVHRGQPGYGRHLDRDGDGVGCE
ncbi:excalibur calcium-binding domain-containing protein [Streptomyces sp. TRM49041]|uniref:excalibur calcium-binding domain-containing protein n=1 Tax=Streptomyces sp. TRM49041 TaxID=2603216 RepID=UPI0021CCB0CB|nr:excalibur calcium-binding domain-containing protein [Streptomyces sp. TRM49041]